MQSPHTKERFNSIQTHLAYNNLGNTLKLQGELASALTSYKKAIQIDPEFADAYYNLGIVLKEQGKCGNYCIQKSSSTQTE